MATGKQSYVYRLMKAKCSCGDKKFLQNLNVVKDHGVLFQNMDFPLMNANDHISGKNIVTFGRCKSLRNPGGAVATGLMMATLGPVIGLAASAIGKAAIGCKCEPMTLVPWIEVNEDYFIDGAPAITLKSELPCYYGGVITIELEKVDDNSSKDISEGFAEGESISEREDKTAQLPSEIQEKIDRFCDEEQTNVKSRADEALEQDRLEEEKLHDRYLNLMQLAHFAENIPEVGSVDYNDNFLLQPLSLKPEIETEERLFAPIDFEKGE